MADIKKKHGNTEILNEMMAALMICPSIDRKTRLMLVVMRKTWGWHLTEATITLREFSELTNISIQNICHVKNELIRDKMILCKAKKYSIVEDYKKWTSMIGIEISAHSNYPPLEKQKIRQKTIAENGNETSALLSNTTRNHCQI
ncbi:MAG: replication protein, partial [Elusimicrobiota bacterium]|nr:replication protein [Elusimicrobiota bacterium]